VAWREECSSAFQAFDGHRASTPAAAVRHYSTAAAAAAAQDEDGSVLELQMLTHCCGCRVGPGRAEPVRGGRSPIHRRRRSTTIGVRRALVCQRVAPSPPFTTNYLIIRNSLALAAVATRDKKRPMLPYMFPN